MKKLKIDDLQVDSFATTAAGEGRRTVRAHEGTEAFGCTHDCNSFPQVCSDTYTGFCQATCDPFVCSDNPTCPWGYPTCNESCTNCNDESCVTCTCPAESSDC